VDGSFCARRRLAGRWTPRIIVQPDETYVKIGVGRDYADVAPVSGTYKGTTDRTLSVEVKIEKRN